MNANIEQLRSTLVSRPNMDAKELAEYLAYNGVLAVSALTDDQCYELSNGQHSSIVGGWNMRIALLAIANGAQE